MRVVLASSNPGKLRELDALLAPLGFELVTQTSLGVSAPPETGETFVENCLLKARHAASATHAPAIADDSGIEVDALGGRPGVHSARFAGVGATDRQNLEKLLEVLRAQPGAARTARYRCVIAFVRGPGDAAPILADAAWEGAIIELPRGMGGFGYDSIFLPEDSVRTAAELTSEEKNAVSHRGQALRTLVEKLRRQGVR